MSNRMFLKSSTIAAHKMAEASWIGSEGFESRAHYEGWLSQMLMLHTRLGGASADILGRADLVQAEACRIAALCDDLGQRRAAQTAQIGGSQSWAWGVQYALCGSAIGASVMLKSRAVKPDWPRAYLETMKGFAVSGKLAAFFDGLEQVPLKRAEARRGAEDVFDGVIAHV